VTFDKKNIFPTPQQALFLSRSYLSSGDLHQALKEFKKEFGIKDQDRWCTLNAVLVAEAAILSGEEGGYSVDSGTASTSKGGSHVAGKLNGVRYDLAALQYGPQAKMTYKEAPKHFRTQFLEAAREALMESAPKRRLRRTAQSLKALLRLEKLV